MFDWLNKLVASCNPTDTDAADSAAKKSAAKSPVNVISAAAPPAEAAPASSPVSRMILLDRSAQILGYEFVSRSGLLGVRAADPRNQLINDQLLVRTILAMGADRIAQFRQIWLSVGELALGGNLLDALPAKATLVLIRPGGGAASPEALQQARQLRAKGFRFGLNGFADRDAYLEWLPLVDVVALDIGSYTPDELVATLELLHERQAGLKVLARRIDSYEEYEYCMAKGFDSFSGKFLTYRESWPPQPPLNPDRVRLCNLLNELRNGAELTDIAAGLKLSPELSYRFLRYINSAGMGTSSHIGSLEQGALYLGREKLYRWFTLLLFSGSDGQPTDAALLEQALVRGRLMELMAGDQLPRIQREELFVTGVFSVLDVLLRVPIEIAIRPLQLPPPVTQAILGEAGPYFRYLKLAKVCEECEGGDAALVSSEESVAILAEGLGLSVEQVNLLHLDAVAWAQQLQVAPTPS
jgi:EAL and modified HD-GYP domain-containing signal transduction protein